MTQLESQVGSMDEQTRAAGLYLVRLIAAGLRAGWSGDKSRRVADVAATAGDGPEPATRLNPGDAADMLSETALRLPEDVSWERVFLLARKNSVAAMAWPGVTLAVAASQEVPQEELMRLWKAEADQTLWRRLQFDAERERVVAALNGAGLATLPLKGINMATYYPDPSMRSMADNDILYGVVEPLRGSGGMVCGWRVAGGTEDERAETRRRATRQASALMRDLGYLVKNEGTGSHDTYHKAPCFNFELHRGLMDGKNPALEQLAAYYKNPWLRALPAAATDASSAATNAEKPLSFYFGAEDEYVYHLAHMYKHFEGGGVGLRPLIDEAVFLHAKGDGLDKGVVAAELDRAGLTDFEVRVRHAAESLVLGLCEPSDKDRELVWFLLGCGTYGSIRIHVKHQIERAVASGEHPVRARVRYTWHRLWLSPEELRQAHPLLARHVWLRPVVPLLRVGRALARLPKTMSELRALLDQRAD